MEILYRRPSGRARRHRQELLLDAPELKITLLVRPETAAPREVGGAVTLPPGARLLWYTFPGRPYEVAAFHGPDGELLGHYTNVVRPPEPGDPEDGPWEIHDLCLDVWQPADDPREPRLLDADELERARAEGRVSAEDARLARETAERVEARARAGGWPPPEVERWPLEAVPALRLKRDEPGTYWANRISGRIIAFGIYMLGAVSATSLVFAALTDALLSPGAARSWWLAALAAEGSVLLPAALAGRLPATRRVRRREAMDERSLLVGATACAAAVLVVNDSSLWTSLLSAVYGALALFLAVFAACRAHFDRRVPWAALAGLGVCAAALTALL